MTSCDVSLSITCAFQNAAGSGRRLKLGLTPRGAAVCPASPQGGHRPPDVHAWCRVPRPGRVSGAVAASGWGSAAGAPACALQTAAPGAPLPTLRGCQARRRPRRAGRRLLSGSVFSLVSRAAAGK